MVEGKGIAVRLVIIDLTNGLLAEDDAQTARKGAAEMLRSLAEQYRLIAFIESAGSGLEERGRLEELGLAGFFETVTTSADLDQPLSPAAIRRIASALGTPATQAAAISKRLEVVNRLHMDGVVALLAERGQLLTELPEALAWVTAISST